MNEIKYKIANAFRECEKKYGNTTPDVLANIAVEVIKQLTLEEIIGIIRSGLMPDEF